MQFNTAGQYADHVPGIGLAAPILAVAFLDGDAGQDGDAVIALESPDKLIGKAKRGNSSGRKINVLRFDFLEADNIGAGFLHHARQHLQTQTDGIYVPSGNTHGNSGFPVGIKARHAPFPRGNAK